MSTCQLPARPKKLLKSDPGRQASAGSVKTIPGLGCWLSQAAVYSASDTWLWIRNGIRRSTRRDSQFAARLVDHARDNDPRLAPDQIYYLGDGDKPDYVAGFDESLKAIAEGAGEHPTESFIRISSQVDGKAFSPCGISTRTWIR